MEDEGNDNNWTQKCDPGLEQGRRSGIDWDRRHRVSLNFWKAWLVSPKCIEVLWEVFLHGGEATVYETNADTCDGGDMPGTSEEPSLFVFGNRAQRCVVFEH